jgi:hypothetical protein
MRLKTLIIAGVVLSLLGILIVATKEENGDVNAASMYLVVFAMPAIVIIVLNGLFLSLVRNVSSKPIKVILSVVPILLLTLLSLNDNLTFGGIDANMVFVARVTAIVVAVTNIVWAVQSLKVSNRVHHESSSGL